MGFWQTWQTWQRIKDFFKNLFTKKEDSHSTTSKVLRRPVQPKKTEKDFRYDYIRAGIQHIERAGYLAIIIDHVKNKGNPNDEKFLTGLYRLFAGYYIKDKIQPHKDTFRSLMSSKNNDDRSRIINELGRYTIFKYVNDNRILIEKKDERYGI
jgi:hypothetical protein